MATFFDTQAEAITGVKMEAGIEGNANIGSNKVTKYQLTGYGEVFSVVASIYNIANLSNSEADFTSSPAQDILTQIEQLIAAGHLVKKELGAQGLQRFNVSSGADKVKEGREMLKMISDGVLRLYKSDGTEFGKTGGGKVGTPTISESSIDRQFSSDDKY